MIFNSANLFFKEFTIFRLNILDDNSIWSQVEMCGCPYIFEEFVEIRRKFICLVIQEVLLCPIRSYLQQCWVLWHYCPFMYPSFSKHSSFGIWNHKISTGYQVIYSLISSPRVGVQGITNLDCYTVGDFMFSYIQHRRLGGIFEILQS